MLELNALSYWWSFCFALDFMVWYLNNFFFPDDFNQHREIFLSDLKWAMINPQMALIFHGESRVIVKDIHPLFKLIGAQFNQKISNFLTIELQFSFFGNKHFYMVTQGYKLNESWRYSKLIKSEIRSLGKVNVPAISSRVFQWQGFYKSKDPEKHRGKDGEDQFVQACFRCHALSSCTWYVPQTFHLI